MIPTPPLLLVAEMMFRFWVGLDSACIYLLGVMAHLVERQRSENDSLDETFGKIGVAVPVVA